MALRLTAILLLVMFAVLRFGGRDTEVSPFAELPRESPAKTAPDVAPMPQTARAPRPAPAAEAAVAARLRTQPDAELPLPVPQAAVAHVEDAEAAVEAARADLDMAVIDASVAPLARTASTPVAVTASPAVAVRNDTIPAATLAEVIGSGVNLRAGPSTGTAVVGRARSGDQVMWIGEAAPGWAAVRHPGYDNDVYMSSDYLRRIGN